MHPNSRPCLVYFHLKSAGLYSSRGKKNISERISLDFRAVVIGIVLQQLVFSLQYVGQSVSLTSKANTVQSLSLRYRDDEVMIGCMFTSSEEPSINLKM